MMVPTLFFRFGTDDAMGVTKVSVRDAVNILDLHPDEDDSIQVSVAGTVHTPYTDVTIVGTNQYCYIIDLSDLGIPLGAQCVMMKTGAGLYRILCT